MNNLKLFKTLQNVSCWDNILWNSKKSQSPFMTQLCLRALTSETIVSLSGDSINKFKLKKSSI